MRTLLRNIPTGLYFKDLEHWTSNPDQAHDFGFIGRALKLVQRTQFREMELVLCRDGHRQARLPLMVVPREAAFSRAERVEACP